MLSENIRNYRKQKGYSQETLAGELNVVRQTVSKWEKGYSVPDAVMLEKLAEVFDISVASLIGEAEESAEEKTDIEKLSAQLAIINNRLAQEMQRKRKVRKIALIVCLSLAAILVILSPFIYVSSSVVTEPEFFMSTQSYEIEEALEAAVSQAIISLNSGHYRNQEFRTESHFIYGIDKNNDETKVYLYENYTEFGFQNGYFVSRGGGSCPAVFTFRKTDKGYELIEHQYPEDGERYPESIKEMFPLKYAMQAIKGLPEAVNNKMWSDTVRKAQKYLASIGRLGGVYSYGDIEHVFLSEVGVTLEVCDKLFEITGNSDDEEIGNYEFIEDGKRVVRQTDYDSVNDIIKISKFEYDTGKPIEFTAVDSLTGEIIPDYKVPEKVKYKKGSLKSIYENPPTTVAYYCE